MGSPELFGRLEHTFSTYIVVILDRALLANLSLPNSS